MGVEGGGEGCPNFMEFVVLNTGGDFQCTFCTQFRHQDSSPIHQKDNARQMGFIQVKPNTF